MRFRTRTGPITMIGTLVTVLAVPVFLALPVGGVAQADPPVDRFTGTFTYASLGGSREVDVNAHGTDPVKGSWTWVRDGVTWGSGPVTCFEVSGNWAWLAGPTWDGEDAVFMRVFDGGTPGRKGDTAVVYGTDPGDELDTLVAWCEEMSEEFPDFDVLSGNLNVWDTP